jgi:hypothetical protein
LGLDPGLGLIRRQCIGQGVVTVVDATGHQRPIRIAIDKCHDHFLADAWHELHAETLAAPGQHHPDPARTGLVVFTVTVPGELQLDPAVFVGPDLFAGFADDDGGLGVHSRFWCGSLRPERCGFGDRFEAILVAVMAGFVSDRRHHPINTELISRLLEPISGEAPCGQDLRYEREFDQARELRREDDTSLPTGVWQSSIKRAQWPELEKLTTTLLLERSKDLMLCAWLGEAWLHQDGLEGLPGSLALVAGLCERYPEHLHPQAEDGDQS